MNAEWSEVSIGILNHVNILFEEAIRHEELYISTHNLDGPNQLEHKRNERNKLEEKYTILGYIFSPEKLTPEKMEGIIQLLMIRNDNSEFWAGELQNVHGKILRGFSSVMTNEDHKEKITFCMQNVASIFQKIEEMTQLMEAIPTKVLLYSETKSNEAQWVNNSEKIGVTLVLFQT